MHELSLAQSLIDQLLELSDQHQMKRINRLTVILGPFSGVVADSFAFGFDVLKKEQAATADAQLILETPDPQYRCLNCETVNTRTRAAAIGHPQTTNLAGNDFTCSHCGESRLSPQGGTELILQQLEME
ncbi:hydrogenase maturation nickel metallochaperone HypA/HybF [Desulfogranum mediterraneum]|uniref:hydrogenase maturation nickel metallochaperone HypA/HybF n=1 Tax=Desulfogranum mediterraneum TaxID=160661 RepID=UPI000400B744|nr:hydrogenase maturation nickel metallochaperone HypA [Desulfogranum mediterraneum]